MKPSVGQIVHYVEDNGQHCAAIVVEANGMSVNLTLFTCRPGEVQARFSVMYDDACEYGTWHWPERTDG